MTIDDVVDDPDFVAFVNYWLEHKRCPLAFCDWLLDRGLTAAAEAARWAATTPDRPVFADGPPELREHCGPMPTLDSNDSFVVGWYWFGFSVGGVTWAECDVLPPEQQWWRLTNAGTRYWNSAFEAIVGLLSLWVVNDQ